MRKILYLSFLTLAIEASAELISFQPGLSFKAQDVNQNFNYIKSLMQAKSIPVDFKTFLSNEVVEKNQFEIEFDKVRALGVQVSSPSSLIIKADELNTAFLQMATGVMTYDDIPIAENFNFSLNEDNNYSGVFPVINYTGPTSIIINSNPQFGSISVTNNQFSYTPSLNFFGNDEFYFTAYDGKSYSEMKKASISVSPINDAPTISSDNVTVYETVSKSISLSASDVESAPLTYTILSQPIRGTLSGSAPNLTYTSTLGYTGSDNFTVQVNDGNLSSQVATININIIPRIGITKGTSYRSYSDNSAATSCEQYLSNSDPKYIYSGNTGTGVYLVDPDAGSLTNAYSEYCNFVLGGTNINNVKFQVASAGYGQGPTYIQLNNTTASVSYGRGWTIVAYNKNLEQINWGTFDTYGGGTTVANNMANFLNNLPNGTIIAVVTADEPRDNFNSNASTALSRYGCSVPGLGYRSAYSCVGMKTSTGTARLIGGTAYNAYSTNNTYFINWRTSISPY